MLDPILGVVNRIPHQLSYVSYGVLVSYSIVFSVEKLGFSDPAAAVVDVTSKLNAANASRIITQSFVEQASACAACPAGLEAASIDAPVSVSSSVTVVTVRSRHPSLYPTGVPVAASSQSAVLYAGLQLWQLILIVVVGAVCCLGVLSCGAYVYVQRKKSIK